MIPDRALRIATSLLILLVVALVLTAIGWAAWQTTHQPDVGALWTQRGSVYYAHPDSRLDGGDIILRVDDTPLRESFFPYYLWQPGDSVRFDVLRRSEPVALDIVLSSAAPPVIQFLRMSIILVAVMFWGVGTIVALFAPADVKQATLLFLCFQTIAAGLALGNVTGSAWGGRVSIALTWWTIALAVHFHFIFPFDTTTRRSRRRIGWLYVVPFLGIIVLLAGLRVITLPTAVASLIPLTFYAWVFAGLAGVLWLLMRAYRRATQAAKRQIGLVVLCGFIAFMPLLSLSVFPNLVLGESFVPTELVFPFLMAIPLGYAYSITQYQLIRLERYISRSATAIIVVSLLSLLYFGITALLDRVPALAAVDTPLNNLITVMVLVVIYNPLYRRLRTWIDRLFYGGWYDYPSVVGHISYTLEHTSDIKTLAHTLVDSIQKSMRVQWSCLLLPDGRDDSVRHTAGQPDAGSPLETLTLAALPAIIDVLRLRSRPVDSRQIAAGLEGARLTATEAALLTHSQFRLWVPVQGRHQSTGVLILGPKSAGDVFDQSDMEILEVVSRQASIALQNVQLIRELEDKAQETERYQKEIVRAVEEERKRISRDLHDQIIQALVGMRYQIANVQLELDLSRLNPEANEQVTTLQEEITELIQTTRALCQDLRPPALDLGLIPSIRSVAGRFEMKYGIPVTLLVEGDRALQVDEDVALCLYRCTVEALANIQRHASAESACITLAVEPDHVQLIIQDDGRGFVVPDRLGRLMEDNHFGLVSMRERLELVRGTLRIDSLPEQGTILEASIPLQPELIG